MIGAIILGLLAGFIAKALMPGDDPGGFFVTILLGLAGSLVGFFIFTELLGIGDDQTVRPRRPRRRDHRHDDPARHLPGRRRRRRRASQDRTPRRRQARTFAAGSRSNVWPAVSAPAFDLQSHSVHSDGELPAAQVVENAAQAGVELLALSDHDTVDGVDEALAAGAVHGVRVVPATEISAVDGQYEDLHVLGYGIDHRSALLGERLLDARADRERRADAMADRLRELGFEVDPAPIEARKAAGKPVGRPHLAAAVLAHPANAERLAAEGHSDVSSFIPAYLIQGKPGYVARSHPTVEEAIAWIHEAAGVAVWAHPFWDVKDSDEVLRGDRPLPRRSASMASRSSTPSHTREQTRLLARRTEELGLLSTGSSDYHGPGPPALLRFRAFDLHGCEPNLGPIAHGTLAAPSRTRLGPLLLAHRACRAPASPRWAGSPPASCATAAITWRCSTATTCARTSAPASASRARTAT